MENIVIFGSSGFLGANLLDYFALTDKTYGIHGMSSGVLNLKSNKRSTNLDLEFNYSNLAKLIEKLNPSVMINSSGLIGDALCERFPELARNANSEIPKALAELSDKFGFYLIHFSTDAVFNDNQLERHEGIEPKPDLIYGRSKLEGEMACLAKNRRTLVVRTNFVGINHERRRSSGLFCHFATGLSQGLKVQGYADVFFNPVVMNPLMTIIKHVMERRLSGILHVAGLDQLSKYEFAILVAKYLEVRSNLVERVDGPTDQIIRLRRVMTLDNSKMLALGLHPGNLEEGIRELCENFLTEQQTF